MEKAKTKRYESRTIAVRVNMDLENALYQKCKKNNMLMSEVARLAFRLYLKASEPCSKCQSIDIELLCTECHRSKSLFRFGTR
jgi:hypothetical protein